MSIVQKNLYTVGQNLNNQAENIDLNRVADDKSFIEVNFGTSPATVTIKIGSIIEVNGNQYAIETSDESFQMSSTAHNYITFNGTTFASAASAGTFDPAKGGYYTGTVRTLKWYIDQTNSEYSIDLTIVNNVDKYIGRMTSIKNTTAGAGGLVIRYVDLIISSGSAYQSVLVSALTGTCVGVIGLLWISGSGTGVYCYSYGSSGVARIAIRTIDDSNMASNTVFRVWYLSSS